MYAICLTSNERFSFKKQFILYLLKKKEIFIEDPFIGHLIISYALRTLFSDSKQAINILSDVIAQDRIDYRLKIYKNFISQVQSYMRNCCTDEGKSAFIFIKAVRALDPKRIIFSYNSAKRGHELIKDCLHEAMVKIMANPLLKYPLSGSLFVGKKILSFKVTESGNRFKKVSRALVSAMDEQDSIRVDWNGKSLIRVIGGLSLKNSIDQINRVMYWIFYKLLARSDRASLHLIEDLSQSLLYSRVMQRRQKKQVDRLVSQKYLQLCTQGDNAAFYCFIDKLREQIDYRSDHSFSEDQSYWIRLSSTVENYFIKIGLSFHVEKFAFLIQTFKQMNDISENRCPAVVATALHSLHLIICHNVMMEPRLTTDKAFIELIVPYGEITEYTPFIKSQMSRMCNYLFNHRLSSNPNMQLYSVLIDLVCVLFENKACEDVAKELCFGIRKVRVSKKYEGFFTLVLLKAWTSHLIRKKDYNRLLVVNGIARMDLKEGDAYNMYLIHLLPFVEKFHNKLIRKIIEGGMQDFKSNIHYFLRFSSFYGPAFSRLSEVVRTILNIVYLEKEQIGHRHIFELLGLLNHITNKASGYNPFDKDHKDCFYDMERCVITFFMFSGNERMTPEGIDVLLKHVKSVFHLTNFNDPEQISFLFKFHNYLASVFFSVALENLQHEPFISYMRNHFLVIMRSSITQAQKDILHKVLFEFIIQGVTFPLLLEKIFPVCLPTRMGKKIAGLDKIKNMAGNPVLAVRMLANRIPLTYPVFQSIVSPIREMLIESLLEWVNKLDRDDLVRIIYTKDIALNPKDMSIRTFLPQENFKSIRHTGFMIAIALLEVYRRETKILYGWSKEFSHGESESLIESTVSLIKEISTHLFVRGEFLNNIHVNLDLVLAQLQKDKNLNAEAATKKSKKKKRRNKGIP